LGKVELVRIVEGLQRKSVHVVRERGRVFDGKIWEKRKKKRPGA